MTQTNNEREKLDVRYFNEKLRLVLEGLPNYTRSELARELQRLSNTASPISQNEQQEAVGQIYEVYNGSIAVDLWNQDLEAGTKLFTSSPKQAIPEGWKLVPIEPTHEMIDVFPDNPRIQGQSFNSMRRNNNRELYKAMIHAAPTDTANETNN